jgi:hypothetical protein
LWAIDSGLVKRVPPAGEQFPRGVQVSMGAVEEAALDAALTRAVGQ